MAKTQITKTELVWPGKYSDDGALVEAPRTHLPLQVSEVFAQGQNAHESGWLNKLIWGDNLLVMGSLLDEFAGKVDLIYIDPPFATGSDFSFTAAIGEQAQAGEEKAYRDTWRNGTDPYLQMMAERLRLICDLLSPKGSFFLHCDWHVCHLLRAVADETFGPENFLNEIVWYYYNKFQGNVKRFASNHDVVLWYRKGPSYQFKPLVEKRAEGKIKQLVRVWDREKAAIVNAKSAEGRVIYRETDERAVDDVWRISMLQPADRTENCGFPTQKPEALLQRILQAASSEGDLVADFFCGSGTTLSVAEKLNRRWIGCDLGRWGIHAARKRLLSIRECKPFELVDLGKHERQHWQGATFGEPGQPGYVAFLLQLYGARPLASVHVGAVDARITVTEIETALDECANIKRQELHVLGWDWEIESLPAIVEIARTKGIRLLLVQIPREAMEPQAAAKGDVRFLSLAYFEAEIKPQANLVARATLKDFVIVNPELIPDNVRGRVNQWTDYIDSWAVDWDYQDAAFKPGWVAYRTRKERKLPLISGLHTYDTPGRYRVLVRVTDIFCRDLTQSFEVEVNNAGQQP